MSVTPEVQHDASKLGRRDRRMIVVDIENLVGGACTSPRSVAWAKRAFETAVPPSPGDHVVIGTSHVGLLTIGCTWPNLRYVVRSGVDGADLELLAVLNENLAERFSQVIVVSGDGIFTDAVSALGAEGVHVRVVARRRGLSRRLVMAAAEVVYVDETLEGVAAAPACRVGA